MDLLQSLRHDHQKVKRLFERLADAANLKERERLFAELKQELQLHSEIEDQHFYPALEENEEARDLVEEAFEEHDEFKRLLDELDQGAKEDDSWLDQLEELREDVELHVEEEESELFPIAQKLLDKTRADEIAQAIHQAKTAQKTQ
jgi:iron-sulfur cluster repair protein YtfE (RIC family)